MNWYKTIKQADQFMKLLSPEEKMELSHMHDTIQLYQNAIDDIREKATRRKLLEYEEKDIQNNQFFIDKVRDHIKSFKEWVLKNREGRKSNLYISNAIEHFGLTDDPQEAGYILPDGTMLDFSGKNEGNTEYSYYRIGNRSRDHREVAFALGDDFPGGTEGMNAFMRLTGAVRLGYYPPHFMFISFKFPMSEQQKSIVIELGKKRMDKIDIEGPYDFKELRFPTGTQIRQAIDSLL